MPPANQQQAKIEHDHGDEQEIAGRRQADDAAAEVVELLRNSPPLHGERPFGRARDGVGPIGQHQRGIENHSQDKRHRQIAGQKRADHAGGQHRQPHQPIADVIAEKQQHVRTAQRPQHQEIANCREQQRDGVHRHSGEILSQHHIDVGGRNRQQQFVGPLPSLVGPNAHRDRRHEHQQDVRQIAIELIEIGQIGVKKLVRPKRCQRAEHDEQADEHIARRVVEVAEKIAAKDRANDVCVHCGLSVVRCQLLGKHLKPTDCVPWVGDAG